MTERRWVNDTTERYYKEIYCYCRRHVSTDDLAYELTQTVFLRFCEQYHTINRECVRAWLYRVAHHLCADYYRAEYKERQWKVPITQELAAEPSEQDDIVLEETEYADTAAALMQTLNASDKALFYDLYQRRLSYEEMARLRNTTVSAVRKRISRMHKKLKVAVRQLFMTLILLIK